MTFRFGKKRKKQIGNTLVERVADTNSLESSAGWIQAAIFTIGRDRKKKTCREKVVRQSTSLNNGHYPYETDVLYIVVYDGFKPALCSYGRRQCITGHSYRDKDAVDNGSVRVVPWHPYSWDFTDR